MRWSSALLMVVVGFDWSFRPVDILYMVFVDFSLFVFFCGGAIIHELFVWMLLYSIFYLSIFPDLVMFRRQGRSTWTRNNMNA